jgi:hypothetical protein
MRLFPGSRAAAFLGLVVRVPLRAYILLLYLFVFCVMIISVVQKCPTRMYVRPVSLIVCNIETSIISILLIKDFSI